MASIHDPLYGTVHAEGVARELMDTPEFQRLRRIRQLQLASVVYPSAVHTRFEHAMGAYHLAKKSLRRLRESGMLSAVDNDQQALIEWAALLHDTGHFPGAHMAEEVGYEEADHEAAGARWILEGEIGAILERTGIPHAAERIAQIIRHEGDNPLRGIVAGACDVDKIDYIARDGYHCGLPHSFNRDNLLDGYVLVRDPETGDLTVGLREKAVASFEQMLYSKFNLYRSVYFHPTVRSATVMMRALVIGALRAGLIDIDELRLWTDEELFILLQSRVMRRRRHPDERELVGRLVQRIQDRDLYRQALSLPLSSAPDLSPDGLHRAEAHVAEDLGLAAGEVLLDIPHKPTMLSLDILVRRSDGRVVRGEDLGPDDGFALGTATEAFYHSSGRWGLFSAAPLDVDTDTLLRLVDDAITAV